MKQKKLFIPIFSSLLMFGLGFLVANLNSCVDTIDGSIHEYCVECNDSTYCGIPLVNVRDMIAKYRDERARVIEQTNLFPRNTYPNSSVDEGESPVEYQDSRSIVFDIDALKNYICKIEAIVKKKHNNGTLLSGYSLGGLRFYFTVYPQDLPGVNETPYLSEIKKTFRNKHSLLIVPTYKETSTKIQIDFDPQYTDGSNKPMTLETLPAGTILNVLDPLGCAQANVMNHGGMCPPKCNNGALLMRAIDEPSSYDISCPVSTNFNYSPPSMSNQLLGLRCYPFLP
ncbi:MAG: hypothetical protein ACKVQB_05975 [Bacteroidia bacterium]